MKKDILVESDVVLLVDSFYSKLLKDELLKHFFVHLDLKKHLPVMYKFWGNILLYNGWYTGNPMRVHKKIHDKTPFHKIDFTTWLNLFYATVDELFEGDNSELAKQRAKSISMVMQFKIL